MWKHHLLSVKLGMLFSSREGGSRLPGCPLPLGFCPSGGPAGYVRRIVLQRVNWHPLHPLRRSRAHDLRRHRQWTCSALIPVVVPADCL